MTSVTAIMNLHREGLLAHASIRSLAQCCRVATEAGLRVTRLAVLDRPDAMTEEAAGIHRGTSFDEVVHCDVGDLGLARNFGAGLASTEYVAFFDADDLWGDRWIVDAIEFITRQPHPERVVCHPEYLYVFHVSDFPHQSPNDIPHRGRSNILKFVDSADPSFDRSSLIFSNTYSSNSLAPRSLYAAHPFPPVDRARGFGVEDWWWNAQTIGLGIRHAVVPGTVRLFRRRAGGSLSQRNVGDALLPPMHTLSGGLVNWPRTEGSERA